MEEDTTLEWQTVLQTDTVSPYSGRVYPRAVVEKAVGLFKKKVDDGTGLVVLGFEISNQSPTIKLDLHDVIGKVVDIKLEGNDVLATVKLLNTPMGLAVADVPLRFAPLMMGKFDGASITELSIFGFNAYPRDDA
jgi:hypothetical protein